MVRPALKVTIVPNFWQKVSLIAGVYLALQLAVLLLVAPGWAKFWGLAPATNFQYWDAGNYAQLALNPACTAFYPLWPTLIRHLGQPTDLTTALQFSTLFSEGLFLCSLPLGLRTFELLLGNKAIAFLAFFMYATGPNAIFHSIGYTESLFGLLSLFFLLAIAWLEKLSVLHWADLLIYLALFVLTVGLGLTRPILVQSGIAIAGAAVIPFGRQWLEQRALLPSQRSFSTPLALAAVIGTGSLVGYSLYGLYCRQTMGDFWGPFQAQVTWGRSLAIRPWLLLFPRSPLIDLHGLYLPLLLVAVVGAVLWASTQRQQFWLWIPQSNWLYAFLVHPAVAATVWFLIAPFTKNQRVHFNATTVVQQRSYLERFSILFAIAFTAVHSLINLFANSGNLYSTARHCFGTPFAFIAIGAVLTVLASSRLNRITWAIAIVGVGLLALQWMDYATDGWLG